MLTQDAILDHPLTSAGSVRQSRPEPVLRSLSGSNILFRVFLVGYTGLLAWACCMKTMSFDELLSFYTARAASLHQLLAWQQTTPVSLDPPFFHILTHWTLQSGLNPLLSMRLPSLCGAVLMTLCAYRFVERLSGRAAAALTVTGLLVINQFHLEEARPYGLMLGFAALALMLWQNVVRGEHRRVSLLCLFATLGLASSSHYFGILLVTPFLLAEAVRIFLRRRLDLAVAAALLGSLVFAAGWLPFLAGAHQYKANYYIKVGPGDLPRAYLSSVQKLITVQTASADWLLLTVVLSLIAFGAWLGCRGSRSAPQNSSESATAAQWTAIMGLALLPFAGVALARLASGAFEIRYVAEFTLGVTICAVALLFAIVRRPALQSVVLGTACILAVAIMGVKAWQDTSVSLSLKALIPNTADGITIITDKEEFLWLEANQSIPADQRARLLWVADMSREMAATHSDNIDRTMLNLKTIAGLPVISYKDLLDRRGPFRLIVNDRSEPVNWLSNALTASHAATVDAGSLGDDHMLDVTVRPTTTSTH